MVFNDYKSMFSTVIFKYLIFWFAHRLKYKTIGQKEPYIWDHIYKKDTGLNWSCFVLLHAKPLWHICEIPWYIPSTKSTLLYVYGATENVVLHYLT